MGKLYFRHGAVSSAKTLNLLAVSHNYKSQGKQVLLLKPAVGVLASRVLRILNTVPLTLPILNPTRLTTVGHEVRQGPCQVARRSGAGCRRVDHRRHESSGD